MKHRFRRLYRYHAAGAPWHHLQRDALLGVFLLLFVFILPVSAANKRLLDRSLYINSSVPGATTSYKISLRFVSPEPVGSLDMLFCVDPIPYNPCVTPAGLDVSRATLTAQSGEPGFSILQQSTNRVVLTRTPSMIMASPPSSYTLSNVVNSTSAEESFSIRLKSHQSTDATGPQIDFGSVKGQITNGVVLETQVPPMLIFCVAQEVSENCTDTDRVYYSDMGTLSPQSTLLAQSQMAVGTNASGGFAITANGTSMSAGTNVIDSLRAPTASRQGDNQFGINLAANTDPVVGDEPQGDWANAIATPDYSQANRYKYVAGDVVAFSPNVSLMKKFTVSYVVNSSKDLQAGVYTTTITYIASGRF